MRCITNVCLFSENVKEKPSGEPFGSGKPAITLIAGFTTEWETLMLRCRNSITGSQLTGTSLKLKAPLIRLPSICFWAVWSAALARRTTSWTSTPAALKSGTA